MTQTTHAFEQVGTYEIRPMVGEIQNTPVVSLITLASTAALTTAATLGAVNGENGLAAVFGSCAVFITAGCGTITAVVRENADKVRMACITGASAIGVATGVAAGHAVDDMSPSSYSEPVIITAEIEDPETLAL